MSRPCASSRTLLMLVPTSPWCFRNWATLRLQNKLVGRCCAIILTTPIALSQLATLLRGKLPAADRANLERLLADPDLNDADRVKLHFGLAQVCDARGEYARAATQLRQANALTLAMRHQKGQGYDLEDNARFVENLMAAFTPAFFERVRGFGLDTERPVFIVGLPRSGTTLTEQILAAHSQVFGAGELRLAARTSWPWERSPRNRAFSRPCPDCAVRWFVAWHSGTSINCGP